MRLIDADALLEMYADIPDPAIGTRKVSIYVVRQDILDAPTIDPASLRPKGQWIVEENGVIVCSECGEEHEWIDYRASFCEDCGADMRGGEGDG